MINVAIIGCGNICAAHVESYLKFKDRCRIVALVDIVPEKAQGVKERFGMDGAAVFDSHVKMIESGIKVDLVSNCTPPFVHASISIDCMERKMNVLVEKPMSTCLAECDRMIDAQKRNGVVLAVGAQNRFNESISKLKMLSDSGLAGRIRCAHVNSLWWRGHCYYDLWWRGTWEKEGGGPTLNHAVHQIDQLNWFMKSLPIEVTSVLANVMHDNSEVEDLSFAVLRYDGGALANVTSSVVHHGGQQGIILVCENAQISVPFGCKAEVSMPNGFGEENNELVDSITGYYDKIKSPEYEGFDGEIDDVLGAVEHGREPLITGEDGRKTVELITAIYKAGFLKRTVTLPIAQEDEYYDFNGVLKNATRFYKKAQSVDGFEGGEITLGNF